MKGKRFPRSCLVVYALTIVSAILYLAFTRSTTFADWFNNTISRGCRRLLSALTVWFPFSLAELLLILSPFLIAFLVFRIVRALKTGKKAVLNLAGRVLSIVCLVGILFVWCFAPGYYAPTLDQKLGLERKKISAEELYRTACILIEQINPISETLLFNESGSSVMPYSYPELNRKLMSAYKTYTQGSDYPDHFYSRIKTVALSEPMCYTHITGVYTFFTGEANVNIAYPDYCTPYTAAHELAHQRGVAREDEANFVAFLVCLSSDDPYIRYSGLLNVYEYVASALYSADKTLYREAFATLSENAVREERAFSAFFERYRENVAATVSEKTNNAYLQSQGTREGTRSYNMVVDLTVAYYCTQAKAE